MASDPTTAPDWLTVTTHAAERWHARLDDPPGYGPIVAWNRAEPLPEPHGLDCDEARYDAGTGLVLVAKEPLLGGEAMVLVTVLVGERGAGATRRAIERVEG